MAIDRIGKGAGLPPTPDTSAPQAAGGAAPTGATFKIDRPEPAAGGARADQAGAVDATREATPLDRLRAGEVDVHGYIDLKVDEATSPLKGLSAAELDDIKSVLRDQMKSDPGLAELVRSATGAMPKPPED
jgi:hypothetical protein